MEKEKITPKLGDVFKFSDYNYYLEFAQSNGYQIIDYGLDGDEKLFMVREMPVTEPTQEQLAKKQIQRLKQRLADTDYVVIKIAEGEATNADYIDILEQRKSWRAEINSLEAVEDEQIVEVGNV